MTISIDFGSSDENQITAEEVLIGAYDIISRAFSQEEVIRAYYRTDPDTMDMRPNPEYPAQVQRILERDTLADHLSNADQLARHDL